MKGNLNKERYESYCNLMTDHNNWQRTLGVITCKRIRDAENAALYKPVGELLTSDGFWGFMRRKGIGWRVAMTGGSYDGLHEWAKLNKKGFKLTAKPAHRLARSSLGIIQLTNLVIYGFCRAIFFFNDPEDYYADSPQNLALRRICNEYNVPLLEDLQSIEYVLAQWSRTGNLPPKTLSYAGVATPIKTPKYPQAEIQKYVKGDKPLFVNQLAPGKRRDRSRETLAIVSHDEKKIEILSFCLRFMEEILTYKRILTTGTTGRKLKEMYAAALANSRFKHSKKFRKKVGWSAAIKDPAKFLEKKIVRFESGPWGGDIQISSKIIIGTCHRVIFFQDPQTAHPHQFDIRLMEKATQDPVTGALFATSEQLARLIL